MGYTIPMINHHSIDELRTAIKQCKDEKQKTRLRAMFAVKNGVSRAKVSEDFSLNIDTITDWIKKYNSGGIDALATNKGGRPEGNPKWDTIIFVELVKEINKQKHYWSIPVMIEWIAEHYQQTIPQQTVWCHMGKLNMSYKSARPHPHLGDKEQQELFKKGALKR
jgi:transposase